VLAWLTLTALLAAINHLKTHSLPQSTIDTYLSKVNDEPNMPLSHRQSLVESFSEHPLFFSWDIPRTREGFYHYRAGKEAATKRAIAYAPYADLLWLETAHPSIEKAAAFAADIRRSHPGKQLVYNLSPSFNWMGEGFDEASLKSFIWELAKHGFVLQLISLAGLHSTATITAELSRAFKTDGMLAYVDLVQKREKELGVDVLTHQKWSGAQYVDGMLGAIQSGSSGSQSMGEGNTESGEFAYWRLRVRSAILIYACVPRLLRSPGRVGEKSLQDFYRACASIIPILYSTRERFSLCALRLNAWTV